MSVGYVEFLSGTKKVTLNVCETKLCVCVRPSCVCVRPGCQCVCETQLCVCECERVRPGCPSGHILLGSLCQRRPLQGRAVIWKYTENNLFSKYNTFATMLLHKVFLQLLMPPPPPPPPPPHSKRRRPICYSVFYITTPACQMAHGES